VGSVEELQTKQVSRSALIVVLKCATGVLFLDLKGRNAIIVLDSNCLAF